MMKFFTADSLSFVVAGFCVLDTYETQEVVASGQKAIL
jgi:hypothetical protein